VTRRLTRVETPGYDVARAVSAATCLFGSGLRYIILVRAADHRGLHAERVIFLPLGVIAVRRRADASRTPARNPTRRPSPPRVARRREWGSQTPPPRRQQCGTALAGQRLSVEHDLDLEPAGDKCGVTCMNVGMNDVCRSRHVGT
jgi:hypothetical protein